MRINKKFFIPFFWIGMPLGLLTAFINVLLIKAHITWFDGNSEGLQGVAKFMGWCMVCSIPTIAGITYGIWCLL